MVSDTIRQFLAKNMVIDALKFIVDSIFNIRKDILK